MFLTLSLFSFQDQYALTQAVHTAHQVSVRGPGPDSASVFTETDTGPGLKEGFTVPGRGRTWWRTYNLVYMLILWSCMVKMISSSGCLPPEGIGSGTEVTCDINWNYSGKNH